MDKSKLYKTNLRIKTVSVTKNEIINKQRRDRAEKRQALHFNTRNLDFQPQETETAKPANKALTKQEQYRVRFLEWKKEKDAKKEQGKTSNKKPPFYPTVSKAGVSQCGNKSGSTGTTGKGHHSHCVPPERKLSKLQLKNQKIIENKENELLARRKKLLLGKQAANKERKAKLDVWNEKKLSQRSKTTKLLDTNIFNPSVTSTTRKSVNKFVEENIESPVADKNEILKTDTNIVANKSLEIKQNVWEQPVDVIKDDLGACQDLENPNNDNKNLEIPNNENHSDMDGDTNVIKKENLETSAETKSVDLNQTPINPIVDSSSNYMSPYVTTSRGKSSAKKEKLKRDSIYTLQLTSPNDAPEVRKKKETVKYFRKILQDEINRLHELCNEWEQVIIDGLPEHAVDMVDVAVGQTKLLTSKKLQQFSGLIDRCETSCNGSEVTTENVLPEDLEGFWNMVKLQVDNIDNRFANLDKWKANNWIDPEEIIPKTKKIIKPKNSVSGPPRKGSTMSHLIRQARMALIQKNSKERSEMSDDVILTPTSKQKSQFVEKVSNSPMIEKRISTGKRRSIRRSINVIEPSQAEEIQVEKFSAPQDTANNVLIDCDVISGKTKPQQQRLGEKKQRRLRRSMAFVDEEIADEAAETTDKHDYIGYYRRILQDEADRLQQKCAMLEQFIAEDMDQNKESLLSNTILQAKQTGKKVFKQFSSLVDQCEKNTDPRTITLGPEDLDKNWFTVKVILEKINKRLDRLEKINGETASNLDDGKCNQGGIKRKSKKPSSVNSLMKQLHEALRKQSNENRTNTNHELENNPKPKKLTILMDSESSSEYQGRQRLGTPNRKKRLSRMNTPITPAASRKSILKIPGTAGQNKSVVFDENPQFRSPDLEALRRKSSGISVEEDVRRLSLRTRSVVFSED